MNVNFENEERKKEKKTNEEKSKPFNFRKAFDDNGNFINN